MDPHPLDPHPLDLQPLWGLDAPGGGSRSALADPWGPRHRPDWAARGLIIWPRGGQERRLVLESVCPPAWRALGPAVACARLALRWWAEAAELRVDGQPVLAGDLFDTACRWPLPERWWAGEPLALELRLRSPLHDDGALIHSRIELEPRDPADPLNLLAPTREALRALRAGKGRPAAEPDGVVRVLGHAHLDLAWLWPAADTWRAAERTFVSTLALMERFPELHFGHSTPALYAWLEQHRPALFSAIRAAMRAGRWEPLNGPWVESDCVLVGTASLLRQFQEGQHYSRRTFPEWSHQLAWLPDSFGFAAGLPAVAAATDVRWFCTHKLAWNASHRFPHRLFRWRSPCGAELLALMTAPIGTNGDPLAIEEQRLAWQAATGVSELLWLPGVGDHGGGPTAGMLEQLALWRVQPEAAPQSHGTLRQHLEGLEPLAAGLPVWRDELYLELHRGCATSRPDQKRHNRTLERLLREAELAVALAATVTAADRAAASDDVEAVDWRPLLFQQFHDILPGTSIPEVFAQAEPEWRAARRRACRQRDAALQQLGASGAAAGPGQKWLLAQLQPLPPAARVLRLPAGHWRLEGAPDALALPCQPAAGGGHWLQLPPLEGVTLRRLRRERGAAAEGPAAAAEPLDPVRVIEGAAAAGRAEGRADGDAEGSGDGRWRLDNGQLAVELGPAGIEQIWDGAGRPCLAAPLAWRRWADRGEFWDAWDIAADHRAHPLPWIWHGAPQWLERGPLCARFLWRGRCGASPLRLEGRLRAASPCLELTLAVDWRQRHELLRLELPLARPALRWAADTPGGVIERPASALTGPEQARWEVAALRWLASVETAAGGGLAVLLDGPQGVSGEPERLGVSLLRAPTWPDPGADNGWQRQRLAVMPCPRGWRADGVPAAALRLREPLWCRPLVGEGVASGGAAADLPLWPALPADVELISLRPDRRAGEPFTVLVAMQNLGPCRRCWAVPPGWRLLERVDGLGRALTSAPLDLSLRPWQLGFWRLALDGDASAAGREGADQ